MRTSLLEFTVPGNPVPKARPRVLRSGITYTPKTTKVYEARIGWAAKAAWREPVLTQRGLGMTIHFGCGRLTADVDNLAKSVLDGCEGVLYRNDNQVDTLEVHRIRANPGFTEVELWIADSNSGA